MRSALGVRRRLARSLASLSPLARADPAPAVATGDSARSLPGGRGPRPAACPGDRARGRAGGNRGRGKRGAEGSPRPRRSRARQPGSAGRAEARGRRGAIPPPPGLLAKSLPVGALGSPHRLVLWPASRFGAHLFPLPTPTPARSFPLSRDSAAAFPAGPTLLRDLCLPAATTFPRPAGIWFSLRRFLARWALPWPVAARAAQDALAGLGALCPQRGKKAGWGRWPGVPWLWASAQSAEAFGGLLAVGIRSICMVLRLK